MSGDLSFPTAKRDGELGCLAMIAFFPSPTPLGHYNSWTSMHPRTVLKWQIIAQIL